MKQVSFMPAAGILAGLLALCLGQAALAAPLLSLKGSTGHTRSPDESEVRLSVLAYDTGESISELVERFRQYHVEGDQEVFREYLQSRETRGYVFTKEATGYSIKYAWQDPEAPEQRMVFVVTPALKTLNPYLWETRNEGQAPFTVLELELDGEQAVVKTSLDAQVLISADGSSLHLHDFDRADTFATLEDNTPYYLQEDS